MIDCIVKEAEMMQPYINEEVKTIYFGGGTPSILQSSQIWTILNVIKSNYNVISKPEITLEANPDDIKSDRLRDWHEHGINRLSIGVQTFNPRLLSNLNRVHTQKQAFEAIEQAQKAGFENLSLDLIFAIPGQSIQDLQQDLNTIDQFRVPHLATYNLTVEPKTVFGNWLNKGKLEEVDQDIAATHYELVIQFLMKHGYEHYEISNFALPGYHSQHNSGYWQHKPYLGLGPGAHSYNGNQRHFNIANNSLYMKGINNLNPVRNIEDLSIADKINEFILTGLRSSLGCDLQDLNNKYSFDLERRENKILSNYIKSGYLELEDNKLKLTGKGKFIADQITADFIQIQEL